MNTVHTPPDEPVLVLVTGVGRSGTSMMSGTLHHLGLHVPGPFLGANESNPKGFFESRWAVRFHNALAEAAGIYVFDARPEAVRRVQAVITEEHHARLGRFLDEHLEAGRTTVVKDPRTVWTQQLWREEARARDARIGYVAMLRHPAEVAASRSTYYADGTSAEERQRYQTASVARWVNNTLISESQTRGESRSFVSYTDMLSNWRAVMRRLASQLHLDYPVDLDAPNPADDFVDPGLRRHEASWDEMSVPTALRDLAQDVWTVMQDLVEDPESTTAGARLDECARTYGQLVDEAVAVARDWIDAAEREARATTVADPRTPAALPLEQRALQDVRAGQLLGVLANRIVLRGRRAVRR